MHAPDPLDRLRSYRNPPQRDASMHAIFGAQRRRLARSARSVAGVSGAWETLAPPELARAAAVVRCTRGVLTVRARDAATIYRLNQWLASGGLDQLRRHSGVGLTRVKFLRGS